MTRISELLNKGQVAFSAANAIQLANIVKRDLETESWVADVRPSLSLYLLMAVDRQELAPDWLVQWMHDTGMIESADDWLPSRVVVSRLFKMRRHRLVAMYRHGAIVYRLMAKRLARVDPQTGALIVRSPSVLWERVDMMSRMHDEATDRLHVLMERMEDA